MSMKSAFITGVSGMDGSYLAEYLLSIGYSVHGLVRRSSSPNLSRLESIIGHSRFHLHYGDMTDSSSLSSAIEKACPDEIYNLAAMSHVKISFEVSEYTSDVAAIGTLKLLNVMLEKCRHAKLYQACTSEMYGGVHSELQDENTSFHPKSPYAVAKLFSYWICKNYRESYGLFVANGILFNHTSPRRGDDFVEQKIVKGALAIKHGLQDSLSLGNLYASRDFGHSKDFVIAMWMMLQHEVPDDFVVASGTKITIKDLVCMIFEKCDMKLTWTGEAGSISERGMHGDREVVLIDEKFFRPSEVNSLQGNCEKARLVLGWNAKYDIDGIIDELISSEELHYHRFLSC